MTIYQFAVVGAAVGIAGSIMLIAVCIIAKIKFTYDITGVLGWAVGFGAIGALLGWVWNI